MNVRALTGARFVRRTQLGPGEYRKNFRQIDAEVITALTSEEADRVTPLMSKVYLRLANAPARYWEREGVLRFEAEEHGEKQITAWVALCELLGVASATARKALRWMHEQGVIGYFAGRNGAGIRVFLNRAASSIGRRGAGEKILGVGRTSSVAAGASRGEACFSDSFAVSEVLETGLIPPAPQNGADNTGVVKTSLRLRKSDAGGFSPASTKAARGTNNPATADELTELLLAKLEPAVRTAAAQAAAREHELTREWLESRGLPKAARVAQREAYNVLRQHGVIGAAAARTRASIEVGRGRCAPAEARQLSPEEVRELAETCVAMLEVHGQAINVTLAELSPERGGVLLAEDASKVREMAQEMATGGCKEVRLVV